MSLSFAKGLRPSAVSTPLGMPSPSWSALGSRVVVTVNEYEARSPTTGTLARWVLIEGASSPLVAKACSVCDPAGSPEYEAVQGPVPEASVHGPESMRKYTRRTLLSGAGVIALVALSVIVPLAPLPLPGRGVTVVAIPVEITASPSGAATGVTPPDESVTYTTLAMGSTAIAVMPAVRPVTVAATLVAPSMTSIVPLFLGTYTLFVRTLMPIATALPEATGMVVIELSAPLTTATPLPKTA
jgi:hypothetical protein